MKTLTPNMIMKWGGPDVYREGAALIGEGLVQAVRNDPPFIHGVLLHCGAPMHSSVRILADGSAENHCPCADSINRGIICRHAIALALAVVRNPDTDAATPSDGEPAATGRGRGASYLTVVPPDRAGAAAAELHLVLPTHWQVGVHIGIIQLYIEVTYDDNADDLDSVPRDMPLAFSESDSEIIRVIEDFGRGKTPGIRHLSRTDFHRLLTHLQGTERLVDGEDRRLRVMSEPVPTRLSLAVDPEDGEIELDIDTPLPEAIAPGENVYCVSPRGGWVFRGDAFWPLATVVPNPYQDVYEGPLRIPRDRVIDFMRDELPLFEEAMPVDAAVTLDLFDIRPAEPHFRLVLRGSMASLSASLYAGYGAVSLVAGTTDSEDTYLPDADDIMQYRKRNLRAETRALETLIRYGVVGEDGSDLSAIVGEREVLNFLGGALPPLRRRGWTVEFEGRVNRTMKNRTTVAPVVRISQGSGVDWFEIGFDYAGAGGASLTREEIEAAVEAGNAFVKRRTETVLIDTDAIESLRAIISDCAGTETDRAAPITIANLYGAYVQASLDAMDGVEVEADLAWKARAEATNSKRGAGVDSLPASLLKQLRDYQKQGIGWLRQMEVNGYNGILADEMGLGKTVQALSWLRMPRAAAALRGVPALVICPTSLVENWAEEAQRFIPEMKTLTISGPDRHQQWQRMNDVDLVITSYALIRRDIEEYEPRLFSALILDEAQAIKNPASRIARTVKQLHAAHRVVLTGTPVENTVTDLWSQMDFLQPGYLGNRAGFRRKYEAAIQRGGPDAERAQANLRNKIKPFILRRMKADVARDLPPKVHKTVYCRLSEDQQAIYSQLVAEARERLLKVVMAQGFEKSRIEVLSILMRLRQACCHLDLLDLPRGKAKLPSAKLELFHEYVSEAIDSGHRILVFSQFVSMLKILRRELDDRQLRYCYLDGATADRMSIVHEFNVNRDIPLFLISLKAGGSGLTLTGADMVIHFDPWWNPAVEHQATERAHRIGQKRMVYSIKLITRGTIEEKVMELQQRKQDIIDATIQKTDNEIISGFSWDDVQSLLKPESGAELALTGAAPEAEKAWTPTEAAAKRN